VPLMAFVLIRAGVPNLVSECSIMEYFINEELAMQQGGYLVATLQTCLSLIGMIDHRVNKKKDKEREKKKKERERKRKKQKK